MKSKICGNCIYWVQQKSVALYKESVAGIGLGSCECEASELAGQTTPEDGGCVDCVTDDFECTNFEGDVND